MKTCPICNKRLVPRGCVTCCNSYCQQASYLENAARCARPRKRAPLREQAALCAEQARRWP